MSEATVTAYLEPTPEDDDAPRVAPSETVEVRPVLVPWCKDGSFTEEYYLFDLTTRHGLIRFNDDSSDSDNSSKDGKPQWLLRWFDPYDPDDGEHIVIDNIKEPEEYDETGFLCLDSNRDVANAALAKYGFRLGEWVDSTYADEWMCMDDCIYNYWTLKPAD